jgi:hypothetical protein
MSVTTTEPFMDLNISETVSFLLLSLRVLSLLHPVISIVADSRPQLRNYSRAHESKN